MTAAELPPADAQAARDLTDRIKVGVEAVWHLITEAYTSRAWAALGYRNWDEYCTREFGTSRLRLPREERAEVVASLRESGLSIRAIATVTGDSVGTVHAITTGVQNRTPDPQTPPPTTPQGEPVSRAVGGGLTPDSAAALDALDAMADEALESSSEAFEGAGGMGNYDQAVAAATDELAARRADFIDAATDARGPEWAEQYADASGLVPANVKVALDQITVETALAVTEIPGPRITGTDGKSYPAPKPQERQPNRRPITDSFREVAYDIGRRVTNLASFTDDDRFKKNAGQLAERNLAELTRARDALQRVIDQLT